MSESWFLDSFSHTLLTGGTLLTINEEIPG